MLKHAFAAMLAGILFSVAATAAELNVKRSTIETALPKASQGRVEFLGCTVPKENTALEACAFQAGKGIGISFNFDRKTKAFVGTGVFFEESEQALGLEMAALVLKVANYPKADALDYRSLMQQASLPDKEVQLSKGVLARLRKLPPSLYLLAFVPVGQ